MTGTCIMGAMREDRAPVKWNKKFIYPKSQRSLIQGKRHYDIEHTKVTECYHYYLRNSVGREATESSELESTTRGSGSRSSERCSSDARHGNAHVSGGVCPGNRAQGPNEHRQGSRAHGAKDYRSRVQGLQ